MTEKDDQLIVRLMSGEYNYDDALAVADQLEDLSRKVIIPEMVKLMKNTVPEFKSKNSEFEAFDKK